LENLPMSLFGSDITFPGNQPPPSFPPKGLLFTLSSCRVPFFPALSPLPFPLPTGFGAPFLRAFWELLHVFSCSWAPTGTPPPPSLSLPKEKKSPLVFNSLPGIQRVTPFFLFLKSEPDGPFFFLFSFPTRRSRYRSVFSFTLYLFFNGDSSLLALRIIRPPPPPFLLSTHGSSDLSPILPPPADFSQSLDDEGVSFFRALSQALCSLSMISKADFQVFPLRGKLLGLSGTLRLLSPPTHLGKGPQPTPPLMSL